VTRCLGPVQRSALEAIADAETGITVPVLARLLDLESRRARKLVETLLARGEVVAVVDPTGRRIWLPARLAEWKAEQAERQVDREWVQYLLGQVRAARLATFRPRRTCPTCGQPVESVPRPTEVRGPGQLRSLSPAGRIGFTPPDSA
jgi:hypothetical protein